MDQADSFPVTIYESGVKGEKIGFYRGTRGDMRRNEGKIATGRFRTAEMCILP